jgi:hypothetical protein
LLVSNWPGSIRVVLGQAIEEGSCLGETAIIAAGRVLPESVYAGETGGMVLVDLHEQLHLVCGMDDSSFHGLSGDIFVVQSNVSVVQLLGELCYRPSLAILQDLSADELLHWGRDVRENSLSEVVDEGHFEQACAIYCWGLWALRDQVGEDQGGHGHSVGMSGDGLRLGDTADHPSRAGERLQEIDVAE